MLVRNSVEIINDSKKEINEFRQRGWGHSDYIVTQEQLEYILNGKLIAIDDGEYTCTIKLDLNE